MTMYFFLYDDAGTVRGSMDFPDGTAAPMSKMVACTAEQAAAMYRYRVDLTDTPAVVEIDPVTLLKSLTTDLAASIDAKVATVYANWTRFQQEYLQREAAARAYKAAGYTGDVSIWISGFANAAGKTSQEAADLIVAQADGLYAALSSLGALRMRKYEVFTASDCDAAFAAHDAISAEIDTVAATIQ